MSWNSKRIWPYSSSRSSKVIDLGVSGKPIPYMTSYQSLIITLAVSATVFEIFMLKDRKLLILPTPPLFDAPARGNPLEFLDETYPTKTKGMGLPYGENFIILTSTVFYDPPVWQTDGQTDGRAIAYSTLSIYAICCRALKWISYLRIYAIYWQLRSLLIPWCGCLHMLKLTKHLVCILPHSPSPLIWTSFVERAHCDTACSFCFTLLFFVPVFFPLTIQRRCETAASVNTPNLVSSIYFRY